ncbi:MAG: hypothetical protein ACOC9S_03730 [Planctomycetota bacterium]
MDEPSDNHRRAEALRAMAEGLNEESAEEKDSGDQRAEGGAAGESADLQQDEAVREDPSLPPVARPATGRAGKAGGAFHKLMVPLLLAVAALLLGLSAVTLIKLIQPDADAGPLATYGWWLILASCPLAGVLVLTAWLLHRAGNNRTGG